MLAGPYGSYQLALLGADVIKVERREGEDMRRTPLSREWAERGMAPAWLAINGNKRSLTLDLQQAGGDRDHQPSRRATPMW